MTKTTILSETVTTEIDKWLAKYPSDQKQSALLAALHSVQEENNGSLTRDLMDAVAAYLDMPAIAVYEAAEFYSMYNLEPVGRHEIHVCTNISCLLRGSQSVVAHLEKRLGVKLGETTPDGKFTLKQDECLGACVGAPMLRIGQSYHENLTPEKIDQLLDELRLSDGK